MPEKTNKRRPTSALKSHNNGKEKMVNKEEDNCIECKNSSEELCHVRMASILKLKDSTKKLLYLLEEIQSKTHSISLVPNKDQPPELIKSIPEDAVPSLTNIEDGDAIKKLESQTKNLDGIYIEDEEDDCSVYRRLTRKCHCLNQYEYNDFMIHFNEDTKYFTSNFGEMIKNMRILKKFVYMGGNYTKHALMFLNDGLSESSHSEKVEITQACSHADVCNVFDEHSVVTFCISWPCKYEYYGDSMTQALAAGVLYKLASVEEGRRYLKFSSKITNDIKRVIRKKSSMLELDTLESLNATLNLIQPLAQDLHVTYYCKAVDEGVGNKVVKTLAQYRKYMTLDEVFMHLDLLHQLSNKDNGKTELTSYLPAILILFKQLLMEYDNSQMNIILTNILNNIVAKSIFKEKDSDNPKTVIIADTATEAITMKNEIIQFPPKKSAKSVNKSKLGFGSTPHRFRHPSKRKESKHQVIIVPLEK